MTELRVLTKSGARLIIILENRLRYKTDHEEEITIISLIQLIRFGLPMLFRHKPPNRNRATSQ